MDRSFSLELDIDVPRPASGPKAVEGDPRPIDGGPRPQMVA